MIDERGAYPFTPHDTGAGHGAQIVRHAGGGRRALHLSVILSGKGKRGRGAVVGTTPRLNGTFPYPWEAPRSRPSNCAGMATGEGGVTPLYRTRVRLSTLFRKCVRKSGGRPLARELIAVPSIPGPDPPSIRENSTHMRYTKRALSGQGQTPTTLPWPLVSKTSHLRTVQNAASRCSSVRLDAGHGPALHSGAVRAFPRAEASEISNHAPGLHSQALHWGCPWNGSKKQNAPSSRQNMYRSGHYPVLPGPS